MSEDKDKQDFYVGYLPVPRRLALFGGVASALTGGLAMGAGAALLTAQDDPGPGRFAESLGQRRLTGILEDGPYPLLRLPPDEDHEDPWALVLAGGGKRGPGEMSPELVGQPVDVGGRYIRRGDWQMLQVSGRGRVSASETPELLDAFQPAEAEQLGAHTLKGELVDSKCYVGAMRPGRGKAHMGCANLCLIGGVPPGFVTTDALGRETWFLLADKNGEPLDEMLHNNVSLYVSMTGDVQRRDNLLIFSIDQSSLQTL